MRIIADAFGVDDSPRTAIDWVYKQEKCPQGCFGVRVVIESLKGNV